MLSKLKFVAALAVAASVAGIAHAYQVSPMIYDMTPTGRNASAVIRVNNTNATPITVELQAERRLFDEAGKESREPADKDFVLFPPQAVIQPGATQAVRVQYVGAPQLDKSVTYTVTVKQIPVQLPSDGKSGVQFVFNFSTVANIVPEGATANVQATLAPDGKKLKLTLTNTGNKYANLALSTVDLTDGGSYKVTIKDEAWRKALGASWILPGGTRVIELARPENAPATLSAKFNYVEATP